jgi:NADPH:quinone reductase-like Zn-dependent oxidoreductase
MRQMVIVRHGPPEVIQARQTPDPVVVGYEVSGVVDAVGPGVTSHREGARVLALTRFGGYAGRCRGSGRCR